MGNHRNTTSASERSSAWSVLASLAARHKARRAHQHGRAKVEGLEDRTLLSAALVKDINTDTLSSYPTFLGQLGQLEVFSAETPVTGCELFVTDGTAEGTRLLKDIYPGAPSSNPGGVNYPDYGGRKGSVAIVGSTMYFVATDQGHGEALWKTDGTPEGTVLVKDVNAASAYSSIAYLTNGNGTLFFAANDGVNGAELWKSDGTETGTVLVKDIETTAGTGSVPRYLTVLNDKLYFAAAASSLGVGVELWTSDGTEAGTQWVVDIVSGPGSSSPFNLAAANGRLYFNAYTNAGNEPWVSDGTAGGTRMLKDINVAGSSYANNFTVVGSTVFFSAGESSSGISTLWKTDGSTEGTVRVSSDATGLGFLKSFNNALYFVAGNAAVGNELWTSDGTPEGTVPVMDINPGTAGSSPKELTVVGDTLFFSANSGTTELWKTDGSAEGTERVKGGFTNLYGTGSVSLVSSLAEFDGRLLFSGGQTEAGLEPWISDGTEAGTARLVDLNIVTDSSSPARAMALNGRVVFSARTNATGVELWSTDGTEAGTSLLAEINPGSGDGVSGSVLRVGDAVYFVGRDAEHGSELWQTDGTLAGTRLVKDLNPGTAYSSPHGFAEVDGVLYFGAGAGGSTGLWRSDGSEAGTYLVKNIGPSTSSLGYPTSANHTLIFTANDGATGQELWRSDGTAAGTFLVKDIAAGSTSSAPGPMVNLNGTLYFSALQTAYGRELWKSDGTSAGTVMIKDINAGTLNSYPSYLTVFNNSLYFAASDSSSASRLWKTDGTAAGTVLIDPIGTFLAFLTPFAGKLFYSAYSSPESGTELWSSDGSGAGTHLVKEINLSGSSSPGGLTVFGNTLYFSANDGSVGNELWQSDGSTDGTQLLQDFNPSGSSTPTILLGVGNRLFISANDGEHGQELWLIEKPIIPVGADAGGPYAMAEGQIVTLNGAASTGSIDQYQWDLDYSPADGFQVDATGPLATLAGLDGPATRTVALRVIGIDGSDDLATTTVTVDNVAPVANSRTWTGLVNEGSVGASIRLSGLYDPSSADTTAGFAFSYDFDGDGTFDVVNSTSGQVAVPSTYYADGPRTLNMTARIADKDGGFTDYALPMTVSNTPPTAYFEAPGGGTYEGQTAIVQFVLQDDVSAADLAAGFTYSYDFDNNGVFEILDSPSSVATVPASYLDDGPTTRTVRGRIADKDGGTRDYTLGIVVNNVAPVANVRTWTTSVNEGSSGASIRLDGLFDPSATDTSAGFKFSYDFDGNGAFDIANSTSNEVAILASYYADGPRTLNMKARVADKNGGFTDYVLPMTVNNVAPSASFGPLAAGKEGEPVTLSFDEVSDPSSIDLAALRYEYDFDNDGVYEVSVTSRQWTHVFADDGTYTVRGRVSDKDGAASEYTATVVVTNAPPVVFPLGSGRDFEGTGQVMRAYATDPSPADTAAGFTYLWTITKDGLSYFTTSEPNFILGLDDQGQYLVTLTVSDRDGGSASSVGMIEAISVKPMATFAPTGSATEGSPATVAFTEVRDGPADLAAGMKYSFDFNNDGDYTDPGDVLDGTSPTTNFTFAGSGLFSIRGRIKDKDGEFAEYTTQVVVEPVAPVEVIVDNTAAALTGNWAASTKIAGYYGSNYIHDRNSEKGSKSVRWTPNLPQSGEYLVYARWTVDTNRADRAPYDIRHAGGTATVIKNQFEQGGQWVLLGTYTFNAGTGGSVTLRTTGTTGTVVADAVRFVKVGSSQPVLSAPANLQAQALSSTQINLTWTDTSTGETGFKIERATSSTGPWTEIYKGTIADQNSYQMAGLATGNTYFFRVRAYVNGGADGAWSATISATPPSLAPSANLQAQAASASQINLTWTDTSTGEAGFKIERAASSTGPWTEIYAGAIPNQSSHQATGLNANTTYYFRVRAYVDALIGPYSFTAGATTQPGQSAEVIVDNTAATLTGTWGVSTKIAGYYGANYFHDSNTGQGSKSVRWTPNLPQSGQYQVYARWTVDTNRASNAQYDITHAGGTTTVTQSQRSQGGVWVLLGTFTCNAGAGQYVTLRNTGANGTVVADAVRFLKV